MALLEPGALAPPLWGEDFIEFVIPIDVDSQNRGKTFPLKAYLANKNRISFHQSDM
jgi:hypothetical protein